LADHLFVFEGDGQIRDFPGHYTDYRIWLKKQEQQDKTTIIEQVKTTVIPEQAVPKKRMGYKEKREFELLEKELESLNGEEEELTAKISSGALPFNELQLHSERIMAITQLIDEKELRWLELSEMME
jgi:ATP-binding cassette subfamily F protein uup